MPTYGLLADEMEHVGGNVHGLALNLVGPAGVVADAANDGANIALGHGDGLAIVERLDGGEKVNVLLGNVGQLVHEGTTLLRGDLGPGGVKGLAGSGYGEVDILLGGLANGGDDFLGGGVDDFKLALVNSLGPFTVDEAVGTWSVVCSRVETRVRVMEVLLTGQWAGRSYPWRGWTAGRSDP